ncbi:hypothetical protein [Phyllobacterium sp. YR531]|uniref:hypothetical protein n=1 Tax=Phyllobacterium sp. YR531 TaxID=1144343 RepID=UPI00026F496B|nr:hypothetical protein [Phyllobacterium sp. YR531]EJN04373.1 hypothetical protein PMI41_02013 [Phyllobacterium sp. YR531]
MSDAAEPTVKAIQKNDDGNWYYVITTDGVEGPKVGPYDTEEEAIADGEERLAEDDIA